MGVVPRAGAQERRKSEIHTRTAGQLGSDPVFPRGMFDSNDPDASSGHSALDYQSMGNRCVLS